MSARFWLSIACLGAIQALVVALPRARLWSRLGALRSRWWGLVPLASIVAVVLAVRATVQSATAITYLALVAVPPLAALALGWSRRARPARALLVLPLFALAWLDRGGLAGEAAGVALGALSCVSLGILLVQVAPSGWLKLGIVLMALADTALVVAQLLQPANAVLNAAAPAAGLPQLQREQLGAAVMGYGDLFVAGVLGAILSLEGRDQGRAAVLTLVLALALDAFFLLVNLLPATVPVACALLAIEWRRRWRSRVGATRRRRAQRSCLGDSSEIARMSCTPGSLSSTACT